MKIAAWCLLIALLTGCAPDGSPPGGATTQTTAALVTLESWCATETPERCVEGMVFLAEHPDRLDCIVNAPTDRQIWEACSPPESDVQPITTIPDGGHAAAEAAYREELERRLPIQDRRALELLVATHPDDAVTVGLVLREPIDLPAAEQLALQTGAALTAVWRTDYVCLPGWEGMPFAEPSRFAYLDGVERAARLRLEMENSTTPVTGAHIPLNAFARMEQESMAIREPGVMFEALQMEVAAASIETLSRDPRVARVRLVEFPTDWLDLRNVAIPECG